MGTYKFTWEHPAEEVYVTGTFDSWAKSEKLDKVGDVFEKTVALADASKKIYYKFVVDGNWVTNETAPQEPDHEGNVNNFLLPEQIKTAEPEPAAAIMSNVTPESTTAALAGAVPLEKDKEKEPIPTPADFPGSFPVTPGTAAELEKPVGINPLPASEGGVNPIQLEPGAPIPPSVAAGNINEHVKLDKESYEKADALPGVDTELPPVTSNMIPESSLPIVSKAAALINSVAPTSTTAALAAAVPLEPKVPEVVKESQQAAHVDPEASADPEEVKEKAAVEQELLAKVPEAPATSAGTAGVGTTKSEGEATGLVGSVVAAATAAKDKAVETASPAVASAVAVAAAAAASLPEPVKNVLPVAVQDAIATEKKEEVREEVSPEVPAEVKESIQEAAQSPEAAANTVAVEEKKAVEAELLKTVEAVPAVGEEASAKAAEVTETVKDTAAEGTSKAAEKTAEVAEAVKDKATEVANGAEAATTTAAKEPNAAEPATAAANNGSASAADAAAAEKAKKKKNRLSAFFSKVKHKFDKD